MPKKHKSKLRKSSNKNAVNQTASASKLADNPSKFTGKKFRILFYIVMFFIPILFFILLELSLRIFNYGNELTQWVEVAPGKLILNPDIAYRYFHSTKGIPYANQNSFDAVKKENSFRIFILGGSSAAGYPYTPNGDFGKYLQKKLEIIYPQRTIEVVNVALTATNSYTILDLIPGVIDQKPDLILIYAGHNEYYGALGVGSMESIGRSRKVVRFMLFLEKFRSINLLRNAIKWAGNIFSKNSEGAETESGTLMSRMAKDKLIAYNSDIFEEGVLQFRDNMTEVIKLCKSANIPIVLSTLTSNLKDQKPFVSISEGKFPPADKVYEKAKAELGSGEYESALNDFILAKDLDGLRFRAPQKINNLISELAEQYNLPIVDVFTNLNSISPDKIVGSNLMTDHLHPTFDGYKILGELFFKTLDMKELLPKSGRANLSKFYIDSLLAERTKISTLDSVLAKYRIIILQNDWPFSDKKPVSYMLKLFNRKNFIDSTALLVIDNKMSWEKAHRDAATYYLDSKNYNEFIHEVNVLISQYPFVQDYYSFASEQLLNAKLFNEAVSFLAKGYELFPNAFYAKWLGNIALSNNEIDKSIFYLSKSLQYASNDAQVLFNLSGAYMKKGMYREALSTIQNCLRVNGNYPNAQGLKMKLEQLVR